MASPIFLSLSSNNGTNQCSTHPQTLSSNVPAVWVRSSNARLSSAVAVKDVMHHSAATERPWVLVLDILVAATIGFIPPLPSCPFEHWHGRESMASLSPPISGLPPEILHEILTHLRINTLLAFGRTCRRHYSAAIFALQNLQLAILPRRIHGILAFLNSTTFDDFDTIYSDPDYDSPTHNQILVPSPLPLPLIGTRASRETASGALSSTPAQHRERLLRLQSALACSILSTPSLVHLRSLTLHTYDITSPCLADIVATRFPTLRQLHLNFSHPYLHDPCLPAQYWTSPFYLQPTSIWNAVAGLGDEHAARLKLTKLKKLTVERAGVTSLQLQNWLQNNPELRELTLRNVAGVDVGFVQWLGGTDKGRDGDRVASRPCTLKCLVLEHCLSLSLSKAEHFAWLNSLFDVDNISVGEKESLDYEQWDFGSALECLSLKGSKNISTPSLLKYLESNRPALRQITLPDGTVLAMRTQPKSSCPGPSCEKLMQQSRTYTPGVEVQHATPDSDATPSTSSSTSRKTDGFIEPDDHLGSRKAGDPMAFEESQEESPVSYLYVKRSKGYSWPIYEHKTGGRLEVMEPDTA